MSSFAPAPTRKTSEASLDTWNQSLRTSPLWQDFMRSKGYLDPDGAVRRNLKLSDSDRKQLEGVLKAQGVTLPSGMKIDESGNFNQKNTLGRNIAIGAGITAATLATMGAAGAFSGAAGAATGAGSGAAAAGAGGTLATVPGAASALLASGAAPGMAGLAGTAGGAATAAGAGGGMSILSKIGSIGKSLFGGGSDSDSILSRILGAAGAGLGGVSSAEANNRGQQLDAAHIAEILSQNRNTIQQRDAQAAMDAAIASGNQAVSAGQLNRQQLSDYYTQALAREQEGRVGRTSAMKDLQTAEYIAGGGASQKAPVTTSGRTLSTMGLGGRASTDTEKQGAAALRKEVMTRLEGGNPLAPIEKQNPLVLDPITYTPPKTTPFQFDPSKLEPGLLEKIGGWISPVLTAAGRYQNPNVNQKM